MLLGFVLLIAGLTLACQPGQGRLPERQRDQTLGSESGSGPEQERERLYVGSKACSACHSEIYKAWQTTSHSYTVLTADEARRAGYPLPRTGSKLRSWSDVSYVVGGRERITYADASGNVQRESYHHRVGDWDGFPSLLMAACGGCHFTGFGSGDSHPEEPALPGRWVERSIGCERCHGPGGRHVTSYDARDIETDYSSRSCGGCHTTVGRVLPEDEWHTTHDLVQAWNRDPHVTGGRFHSQSAFCSRCHAPQYASFFDAERGAGPPVFSEDKRNFTCIGCHNPHEVTSSSYTREKASLSPPLPVNLHAYAGDDSDFTTTDFASYSASEELCIHCHRGADRIELDHANATCTDCHNTFHANRSIESRIDHDANRPRLSCRQCHRDADYLMSIVFDDRTFLQPKNIHDLMSLPADAVQKYNLRYPQLARSASKPPGLEGFRAKTTAARKPSRIESHSASDHDAYRGVNVALQQLLERAVLDDSLGAIRALRQAARVPSTKVLVEFLVFPEAETIPRREANRISIDDPDLLRAQVRAAPSADRAWLEGYLALRQDGFDDAERWFGVAERSEPHEPSFPFYRGITKLGLGQYQEAIGTFQGILDEHATHLAARVALGLTHLKRNRLLHARKELELAIETDPEDPVAHYYLGHAALGQRDLSRAIRAYHSAVNLDRAFLEARYALGRCFRLAGDIGNAARVYRELATDDPTPFEAHLRLANLHKFSSDRNAIQLLHDRESRAPSTMSALEWRARLETLERNSKHYGGLALSELAKALQLRPADVELKRQVSEVLRRAGELERAEAYFRWLSDHRPEEWLPLYRLGTILIQREDYVEAIRVLEQAIRVAPTEGDAYAALGLAFLRTGSQGDAIEALELGTVYAPFNPALHTNLGVAYAEAGELDRAETAFERSLELATFPLPRVHITHTNLALVHLTRGDRDDAMQALRTALHAYPEYEYAREIESELRGDDADGSAHYDFVLNDLLERFGEVTTVGFE